MLSKSRSDMGNVDRYITLGIWAKWLGSSEKEAREKAEECEALCEDESGALRIDLKAIDKAKGTHYVELGECGADLVPNWMEPMLDGEHRLRGF